jgi:hypothetical protein
MVLLERATITPISEAIKADPDVLLLLNGKDTQTCLLLNMA